MARKSFLKGHRYHLQQTPPLCYKVTAHVYSLTLKCPHYQSGSDSAPKITRKLMGITGNAGLNLFVEVFVL